MIEIFSSAVYQAIQGLNFVERWAGAVMPVTVPGSYENQDTGEVVAFQQTLPVSCHLAAECEGDPSFYQKALPDDRYLSLAYIESKGPAVMETHKAGGLTTFYTVRQKVRLVVWLNMQQLGSLACGDYIPFLVATVKALNRKRQDVTVAGFTENVAVDFSRIDVVERSPVTVFGAYTYAVQERYFLHPYSFFALDVDMVATLPMGCFCPPEIEAVECVTVW